MKYLFVVGFTLAFVSSAACERSPEAPQSNLTATGYTADHLYHASRYYFLKGSALPEMIERCTKDLGHNTWQDVIGATEKQIQQADKAAGMVLNAAGVTYENIEQFWHWYASEEPSFETVVTPFAEGEDEPKPTCLELAMDYSQSMSFLVDVTESGNRTIGPESINKQRFRYGFRDQFKYIEACHKLNTRVSLTGFLFSIALPGPPEFESVRSGDRKDSAMFLYVSGGVCINGKKGRYQAIHLACPDLQFIEGTPVELKGELFEADNANHKSPVLMQCLE